MAERDVHSRLEGNRSAAMSTSSKIFRKASSDASESLRRDKDWIRQTANLCAGSRREIESSYSLLRAVQRDLDRGAGSQPADGSK